MSIRHKYSIVCDEVRREDNGKLLIVGMYPDNNIGLPQIPLALPSLTFFQSLESDRPGRWGISLRLEHLETGVRLIEGNGQIQFQRPGAGVNHLRFGPIMITAPGVYNFVMEIEGQQTEPIVIPLTMTLNTPLVQAIQQRPNH